MNIKVEEYQRNVVKATRKHKFNPNSKDGPNLDLLEQMSVSSRNSEPPTDYEEII